MTLIVDDNVEGRCLELIRQTSIVHRPEAVLLHWTCSNRNTHTHRVSVNYWDLKTMSMWHVGEDILYIFSRKQSALGCELLITDHDRYLNGSLNICTINSIVSPSSMQDCLLLNFQRETCQVTFHKPV